MTAAPYRLLHLHRGVGEATGDGGALHHAEGLGVLHAPVRVRPQQAWREQTVGVTTGFQVVNRRSITAYQLAAGAQRGSTESSSCGP